MGLENLTAGDLWFSSQSGRLYIYYIDQDDTGQWVVTSPTGTIPTEGALDVAIGLNDLNSDPGDKKFQEEVLVTISNWAPSERKDGSLMEYGDFWWSPLTGIMYMWFGEQWICTDTSGLAPDAPIYDPSEAPNWYTKERTHPWGHVYESKLDVIVKLTEPFEKPDGSSLEVGNLWFSPITGKMYIRYKVRGYYKWVITNPIAMMPNQYASDSSVPEPVSYTHLTLPTILLV